MSLEEILCSLIVDSHEGHNIDTFDAPGAYLNPEITKDKRVSMKLRGDFVDIMCQVNPEKCKQGTIPPSA